MGVNDIIRSIDIYGYLNFLNYKQNKKFKTVFGGLMFLITFIGLVLIGVYFFIQLISRETPIVFNQLMKNFYNFTDFDEKDYNNGYYPVVVKLHMMDHDDNFYLPFDNKTLSVYLRKNFPANGTLGPIVSGSACELSKFPQKVQEFIRESGNDDGALFDLNDDKTEFARYWGWQYLICFNTSSVHISDAVNTRNINWELFVDYREKNASNLVYRPEIKLYTYNYWYDWDLANYTNPVAVYIQAKDNMSMQNGFAYAYWYMLQKFIVDTDHGWITSNIGRDQGLSYGDANYIGQAAISNDRFFLTKQFAIDSFVQYYKRSYPKIQDTLAQIGGIFNLFSAVFVALMSFVGRTSFREELINEVFNFDKDYLTKPNEKKYTQSNNKDDSLKLEKTNNYVNASIPGKQVELTQLNPDNSVFNQLNKVAKGNQATIADQMQLTTNKEHKEHKHKDENKTLFDLSFCKILKYSFCLSCLKSPQSTIYNNLVTKVIDHYLDVAQIINYFVAVDVHERMLFHNHNVVPFRKIEFKNGYEREDYFRRHDQTLTEHV